MHVIFLVSGAGTYFAMRSRKGKFITDRLKRLIVPFLFGIVVLIPPQRFYEWKMFQNFEGGFLDFLSLYPLEQLQANMGASLLLWFGHLGTHLWYLPYLFVMTIICIPLFKRIQQGKIRFEWLKKIIATPTGVFILFIPMLASRLILKPIFEGYTDWADFFIYLWSFVYGFIFMADKEFIGLIASRRHLLLILGLISSLIFMYLGASSDEMVLAYTSPGFDLLHILTSTLAVLIALCWTLFFLGLFARKMAFKHALLIPANISILPVYILHQTLIIVFGYYIVAVDLNLFIKFGLIVITAIPTSILLYQLIRTNKITRFLFGLKSAIKHKGVVPYK